MYLGDFEPATMFSQTTNTFVLELNQKTGLPFWLLFAEFPLFAETEYFTIK